MNVFKKSCFFRSVCLALISFLPAHYAKASLIGDTVYLHDAAYYEPGYYSTKDGFQYLDGMTLDVLANPVAIGPIVSGSSDAVTAIAPIFDFEASSFSMYWDQVNQWGDNNGNFNGLAVTGINYSPSSVLTGFSITSETLYQDSTDTTMWTFDPNRITFADNAIYLDMHGLTFGGGSSMTVNLQFAPVPLPAGIWLFASGLIFLVRFASVRLS